MVSQQARAALLERLEQANRASQLVESVNRLHDFYHWAIVDYPHMTSCVCALVALVLLLWAYKGWPALMRWRMRRECQRRNGGGGSGAQRQPIDAYHLHKQIKKELMNKLK